MGKRYFCDYCQRSFVDDIESRKKHLNGVSHLRMKKEYYFMIRDMKTLVQEERSKEPCRRFRNTGECSFGVLCNHTHYTPEELAHFETTGENPAGFVSRSEIFARHFFKFLGASRTT
uniref:Zinc finger matrin-type protein 5 n=1 Tax=Lygus hesperus TaxID=30085 RepID=A0A0A9VYE6_LYGHE